MIESGQFRAVKEQLNPASGVFHIKWCPKLVLKKFKCCIIAETIQHKPQKRRRERTGRAIHEGEPEDDIIRSNPSYYLFPGQFGLSIMPAWSGRIGLSVISFLPAEDPIGRDEYQPGFFFFRRAGYIFGSGDINFSGQLLVVHALRRRCHGRGVDNNIRGETPADPVDLLRLPDIEMNKITPVIIRTVASESSEDMVSAFKMLKEVPA